ncbi:MAG: UDP-4-amino-4-deoxy-L-arabinose aminotransferase [Phycisphaerales bacterium]|nr:UDP-4-amino-4-deoxy-L-arabinose aminotransferase [Phycisphaerales bacterium]
MRPDFLPFCRPSISESDIESVVSVLRGGWITTGPVVNQLEELVKARTGAREALVFTSATAAFHCLLVAMGIGPGDEVVTPSMTWVSTPNLIELVGARAVFVDVDRETLMADASAMEAAITSRTRLLVPVHFAGAPVDLEAYRAVARRRGIPLVEDAAHAIGTRYRGVEIGSTGTAIFSLHPIKNITAGEGGVLVTDDAALADRLRRLRFHGLASNAHERSQQGRSPQSEVQEPGFKYNMPDMNAALAVSQMGRLDTFITRREELVGIYRDLLAGVDGIEPVADPAWNHRHSRHLFIVRVIAEKTGMNRSEFMDALKRLNIGTGIHFLAAHTHSWYRQQRPLPSGALANTTWNSERICTLPLFPAMSNADVVSVVDAVKAVLASARAGAQA